MMKKPQLLSLKKMKDGDEDESGMYTTIFVPRHMLSDDKYNNHPSDQNLRIVPSGCQELAPELIVSNITMPDI